VPTEREFISSIAKSSYTFEASALELTPEQISALPVPPKSPPAPAEAAASGPARSYPPLEPSS
jgi:outer membrane protein assembly factor BamE